MNQIMTIAGKEIRDGMRNRWVVVVTLLMAGLALILSLLGSTPTGTTKISTLAVTIVSLSSLSIFFIPLIALLLSYDSIVGESERGTLLLLLAYPVARWQVVVGKFTGHLTLLSAAIILGYGAAGVAIVASGENGEMSEAWGGFVGLLGSSVLLGGVFLAIGLAISAGVRERGTAAAVCVAIWLLFVLVYDMGLLAVLAADSQQVLGEQLVTGLLLANPTDAYRMLNLIGNTEVSLLSGMASLSAARDVSVYVLVGLLIGWSLLPIGAACLLFQRRPL